jgi:CBS domain-containing protein
MLQAKDIMTSEVVTVGMEMGVGELAALLSEKHISGVPVLDDDGGLVGVVTENDLIDQTKQFHIPTVVSILDSVIFLESPHKIDKEIKKMTGTKVADLVSSEPVTVTEESTLAEIATIMAEKGVHTLPVMRGEELVGVVGKSDIIRTMIQK